MLPYQRDSTLGHEHRFFHWPLEFAEVFTAGGFDVALGNPPWDQLQFDPREFFAVSAPEIASEQNMAARQRLIKQLIDSDPAIATAYQTANADIERSQNFIHTSGRYRLANFGRLNLAPFFAELTANLTNNRGRVGIVLPTGIATDSFNRHYFSWIIDNSRLVSLLDFENREGVFPGVHRSYKFCLLTLGSDVPTTTFTFFATRTEHLADGRRRFTLSPEDIALINPNTKTCPIFRSQADAELTKKIYQRVRVLIDDTERSNFNPWEIRFLLMFMMNTDSHLFRTRRYFAEPAARLEGTTWRLPSGEGFLPLYEATMIHQFDSRWATYTAGGESARDVDETEKLDLAFRPMPRYWVSQQEVEARLKDKGWQRSWLLGWRG